MNRACLTGRLVRKPEVRTTTTGVSVCPFTIAVDRYGKKDEAEFIDCVAWRNTAEFIEKYFTQGDGIEVDGHITTRDYEDKDGNKRKAVEVTCDSVSFPKGKKQGTQPTYGEPAVEEIEDLPF